MKTDSPASFKFAPLSKKQMKIYRWWTPGSPYRDHDMILAHGSIRSGKTVAMSDAFIHWSLANFRDQNFILSSKTTGALERNVIRPLSKILDAKGIKHKYTRGDNRHLEIGTNRYWCFGGNNERSQDFVQGLTAAGSLHDEAALQPRSFLEQCKGRCSVDGAKVWLNCNPEDPAHYIKTEIIDRPEENRALVIHFTMDDNLSLSKSVKDRYKRMFSGVFYKRFIEGLWVMAEGAIYKDCWSEDLIFDELPASFKERWIGIDYGTANPMVFLDGWYDGHTLWIVKEYYWDSAARGNQKTDSEYAQDLKNFVGDKTRTTIIVDPSAASFKVELKKHGFFSKDAVNDKIDVENANNIVVNGIRFVSTMFNLKRVRVHRSCTKTIEQIQSYVWDTQKTAAGKEQPKKVNDHAPDALRYMVFTKMAKSTGLKISQGAILKAMRKLAA